MWTIVGKTCIVTGASSGIGLFTAIELVDRGAKRVILACRSLERGEKAVETIREHVGSKANKCEIVVKQVDMGSMKSVRDFANDINKNETQLDVLINNAGILQKDGNYQVTEDGFEITFATNFLGAFLLTELVLDLMKKSTSSRVVMVSSQAYQAAYPKGFAIDDINQEHYMSKHPFSYWRAYSQSKLAAVLMCRHWAKLHKPAGVSFFSLHPGEIRTSITRHHGRFNFINVWFALWGVDLEKGGAAVPIHCAIAPDIERHSGKYFGKNCKIQSVFKIAKDEAMAEELYKRSTEWLKPFIN